ncbi:MAG: B12-binding domain-containing radical SAM protein [Chloroflexi bacterium]|nr:B12-binding domain-containing radical SAM protein [Chloroflexota bacterium]MBU1748882.1 B12-binding domain-containing radical SAM protein [Chloroflexota bacterium]
MRVLILNPAYGPDFVKSARWYAKSRGRVQRHPDYLAVATAVLEQAGHTCKLVDCAAKNIFMPQAEQIAREFQPDMVVLQATTPSIDSDLAHAAMCKEAAPGCVTVAVGAHASAVPDDTLARGAGALDVVARGEYDYTLRDLAAGTAWPDVLGISYWENGTVHHTDARPLLDVNELPFPAWQHIDPYDYPDAAKLYPFITLFAGRGCAGHCTFCITPQVMYGRRYRPRDARLVVDEIEYDRRLYPFLQEIMFEDDTLTLWSHQDHLAAICEEILRRDLRISWAANARPDLLDENVFRLMKRSGCRWLCVGYEFGNQQMLNNVHKGTSLDRMREFSERAHRAGILVNGCFMIGAPGETRETACETIEFAKGLPIYSAQFTGLVAYPGTEYYDWVKENGCLVPQDWPEWVDENHEQRTVVSLPDLPKDEIDVLVDQGLKEFYLRPIQIWRTAAAIRSWTDVRTKFHGLKSFVDYFLHGGAN